MADTPKYYVETATGNIRTVDNPEQAQELARQGRTFVSPETAKSEYGQEVGAQRAQEDYGSLGTAALGAASGLTLGLGPAAYSYLSGDKKFSQDLGYLQGTTPFQLGEFGGMLLPAVFSGGESLAGRGAISRVFGAMPAGVMGNIGGAAERWALRALPEASSAIGAAGRSALSLAARGASEGAIMNMSQAISQGIVQDHPLTAQSFLATGAAGAEGALLGGLLGGATGGLGSLAKSGAKALGGLGADASGSAAMRRIGASTGEMEALGQAGVKDTLKGYGEIMKPKGVNFSSDIKEVNKAALETMEESKTLQKSIVERLDKEMPSVKPSMVRISGRLSQEVVSPALGTLEGREVQNAVAGLTEALGGKNMAGPPTWAKWVESRNQLAERVGGIIKDPGLKQKVYQQALTVLDGELNSAVGAAAERLGEPGLAAQFQAASAQERMAKHLSEMTAKKLTETKGVSSYFNPQDARSAAWLSVLGHPAGAATLLASKAAGRFLSDAVEPFIAQRSYEMAIGAKAANSVNVLKTKAQKVVSSLYNTSRNEAVAVVSRGNATPVPSKAPAKKQGMSVDKFNSLQERVSQLTSDSHAQSVQAFAQHLAETGQPKMAQEVLMTYGRAKDYVQWNSSKKPGPGLTRQPKQHGMSVQDYKALRIISAITEPDKLMDKLADGTATTDEVRAFKYVYPDAHQALVSEIAAGVAQAQQEGKTLSIGKVTQMGIALDAPVASWLEPSFVASLQATMQLPQQDGPAAPSNASMSTAAVSNLMTPLEKSAYT